MKAESILDYYIYNRELYQVDNIKGFEEVKSPTIYEVIRILEGVPLFEGEHIERMRKSAKSLGHIIHKTDEEISKDIDKVIKANRCNNMNIKLLCSNLNEEKEDFMIYFITSSYPGKEVFEKGIHTIIFHSERKNPNAKIINIDLREKVNQEMKKANAYEALLVKDNGIITEGSRSNIFFVKGDKVYTAPKGEVLLGVTRNEIMDICRDLDIEVVEDHIHTDSLSDFDGAFMTGTSVDVLPISSVDNIKYDSVNNQIIKRIGNGYLESVNRYIKLRKQS